MDLKFRHYFYIASQSANKNNPIENNPIAICLMVFRFRSAFLEARIEASNSGVASLYLYFGCLCQIERSFKTCKGPFRVFNKALLFLNEDVA